MAEAEDPELSVEPDGATVLSPATWPEESPDDAVEPDESPPAVGAAGEVVGGVDEASVVGVEEESAAVLWPEPNETGGADGVGLPLAGAPPL